MPKAQLTLESLGLLPRAGRPGSGPVYARKLRDLVPEDLELLRDARSGVSARPLSQIKHAHHLLARLIAEGRRAVECSAITGYTQSTISILRGDPMFEELVEHYRLQVQDQYLNVHERLATVGVTALEEIQQRLNEEPNSFTNRELKETVEMAFDRSVAPSKGSPKGGTSAEGGSTNVKLVVQFVEPKPRPGDGLVIDLPVNAG